MRLINNDWIKKVPSNYELFRDLHLDVSYFNFDSFILWLFECILVNFKIET